jgi:hypothetical protein
VCWRTLIPSSRALPFLAACCNLRNGNLGFADALHDGIRPQTCLSKKLELLWTLAQAIFPECDHPTFASGVQATLHSCHAACVQNMASQYKSAWLATHRHFCAHKATLRERHAKRHAQLAEIAQAHRPAMPPAPAPPPVAMLPRCEGESCSDASAAALQNSTAHPPRLRAQPLLPPDRGTVSVSRVGAHASPSARNLQSAARAAIELSPESRAKAMYAQRPVDLVAMHGVEPVKLVRIATPRQSGGDWRAGVSGQGQDTGASGGCVEDAQKGNGQMGTDEERLGGNSAANMKHEGADKVKEEMETMAGEMQWAAETGNH